MAESILSSILSKASFRIHNQNLGVDTAKGLKVVKAVIRMSADPQRHLLEDGSTFIDTRTVKPIKLQVDVIAPDATALTQINEVASDRRNLYQISTRGILIPDMMIDAELMEQTPENISSTVIKLSFKQILIEHKNQTIVNNPANASIVDRGRALIEDAKETALELFNKASKTITDLVS
jgi:hypothetical protein